MKITKKSFGVLIHSVFLIFFLLPAAYSAPEIDGVMSYTDTNDWGSLSVTTTGHFDSDTTLADVMVEEGDAYGEYYYDVEELGLYIADNTLYIGLQTQYDLSSDPDGANIYAGDFIFTFGDGTDSTLSDYDNDNDSLLNNGDYAFAFDFTVDSNDRIDITFLSGNMTGTGVGSDINNYGTDWGIESATTEVVLSDTAYQAAYSGTNADSSYDNNYYNGKYTLELAIDLDSLSNELSSLLSYFNDASEYASVAMYWQPSCGNDFLAAGAAFNYSPVSVSSTETGIGSEVPEPATMMLFGMGLLVAGALGRRERRRRKSD